MRSATITIIIQSVLFASSTHAGDDVPAAAESPRAVVAHWLDLHRTGKRAEALALTTGSRNHRAEVLPPSKLNTGVRVARSLGNQRAAAVVTSALDDAHDGERVLLSWLVRRDGAWRINKSDEVERRVADERLRGFLQAGDVRWHVQRDEVLGRWEAGPCRPPGVGGVACGSRLELGADNGFRLVAWGPAGPPEGDDGDHVMQGRWRLSDGCILLFHQERSHECRVAWMADKMLVLESLDEKGDGKGRATYNRPDAAQRKGRRK